MKLVIISFISIVSLYGCSIGPFLSAYDINVVESLKAKAIVVYSSTIDSTLRDENLIYLFFKNQRKGKKPTYTRSGFFNWAREYNFPADRAHLNHVALEPGSYESI